MSAIRFSPSNSGRQVFFSLFVFLFGLVSWASLREAKAQPFIPDSIARLNKDAYPVRPFAFAVAGDTRDSLPHIQSPVFRGILAQVEGHRPAFLALLGDLVRGYNIATAPRQWGEFLSTVAGCRVPLLAVAGNHDIWNEASGRLWEERMGPRWYSLDYAGSHFIFLDSEADWKRGITGTQLEWLKGDLQASREARSIFVFLHRPLFLEAGSNWEMVHGFLRRYPVKAVFASHHHRYEMAQARDGIEYYITGGGGAEIADPPEVGGFHHWLLVAVSGESFRAVVMKPEGGSLAADSIRRRNRKAILAARREIRVSRMEGGVGENLDAGGYILLENRSPFPLSGRLEWQTPGEGWQIRPPSIPYSLPRYGKTQIGFRVTTERAAALLGPLPYFSIDYAYGYDRRPVKVSRGLPLVRRLDIPRAREPVVADGKLEEWGNAAPLVLQNRLGSEPQGEGDFLVSVRMMWEPKRFYLAVEVKDDVLTMPAPGAEGEWDVDHIRLIVDPFDKGQGSRSRGIYEYLACETAEGSLLYLLRDPAGGNQHRAAPNVQTGVVRQNGSRIYEFVFDDASLSPLELRAEEAFSLNLFAGDDDGPRHPEKFTLLTLAGTSAIVGDAWPRVVATLKP